MDTGNNRMNLWINLNCIALSKEAIKAVYLMMTFIWHSGIDIRLVIVEIDNIGQGIFFSLGIIELFSILIVLWLYNCAEKRWLQGGPLADFWELEWHRVPYTDIKLSIDEKSGSLYLNSVHLNSVVHCWSFFFLPVSW